MSKKHPMIIKGMASIPRHAFSKDEINTIRNKMVLVSDRTDYKKKPLPLYKIDSDYIHLPRQFALNRYSYRFRVVDRTTLGTKEEMNYRLDYRRGQEEFVNTLTKAIKHNGYGAIGQAKCGFGKTICASSVIANLGRKTLVIVHKDFLLHQWREAMKQSLGVDCGIVKQDRCDYLDTPISIASVKSLFNRDYGEHFNNSFGLVVSDECHNVGAAQWYKVITNIPAKYQLGLTATPRRSDGYHNAFFWQIGKISALGSGDTLTPKVFRVYWKAQYNKKRYCLWGKPHFAKIQTVLGEDNRRSRWIVDNYVVKAAKADRSILILSNRVDHLKFMMRHFNKSTNNRYNVAKCFGELNKREDAKLKEANIIFGTFQKVKEGFDRTSLDTLVLASPIKDIEQACGRIIRLKDNKKDPYIIDVVDLGIEMLVALGYLRLKQYGKLKYDIEKI